VQEKLHEELMRQLPNPEVSLTSKDLGAKHLPYLHMVMREAHRVRPALGNQVRKETQETIELCG
jgi:cytochrome P450